MVANDEFKVILRARGKVTIPYEVVKAKALEEGDIITLQIVSTYREQVK